VSAHESGQALALFVVAQEYGVQRNGAQLCTVTLDGTTLTAVCQRDVDLTFAQVLGLAQTTVTARASASFAAVRAPANVAPTAIRHFNFIKGLEYTIWDDVKDEDPASGDISGAYRGWLNLDCEFPMSCGVGGTSDLAEWMRNGYPGLIEADSWMRGSDGTNTGALHAASVGQLLIIPVYDTIEQKYPGRDYYHIISFAAFRSTEIIDQTARKGLRGHFEAVVIPGDPGGLVDGGLRTVRMTR